MAKYSFELKMRVVEDYFSGKGSYKYLVKNMKLMKASAVSLK